MDLTWYGHGTWHVELGGRTFLVDPYFDPAYTDAVPADLDPDYVLLTHAHRTRRHDLDAFSEATVVANTELVNFLPTAHDLGPLHPLNLGGILDADGAYVLMVGAEHAHGLRRSSYLAPDLAYEPNEINVGPAVGYVFTDTEPTHTRPVDASTFYYTGETQLRSEMRDVVGAYLRPDVVATPIAEVPGMEGRSTMGPWQAAIAVDWLAPAVVLPMVAPSEDASRARFEAELAALGCDSASVFLAPGETFSA
ncbi:MBL fold metallo-hydrolase [Salinirubellus salinus]|jgi:L-ascorbate metabolism protein UlaG (beta-lactamase superfamily)|uniref:MBL fold metallo-hydrolase n=1 Tax=Salinirubellus salinus TaxID=1364945 RepID=A0A9E7UAP9_9EURY|nr:MBL fold metallo-hydrolase [Salinirubellus salinus]UWM54468.1 MBL fold metallo-hydrolase [Salinirubellus salinus]